VSQRDFESGDFCSYRIVAYRPVAKLWLLKQRSFLVTVGKHVNSIRAIARQPIITTIEEVLGAVLSVGSAPGLYMEDPRPAHIKNVTKCIYNIYSASVSPGSVQQILPYF
jgi:hypothetical protein